MILRGTSYRRSRPALLPTLFYHVLSIKHLVLSITRFWTRSAIRPTFWGSLTIQVADALHFSQATCYRRKKGALVHRSAHYQRLGRSVTRTTGSLRSCCFYAERKDEYGFEVSPRFGPGHPCPFALSIVLFLLCEDHLAFTVGFDCRVR
jgi:hypothetical protein